MTKDDAKNKTQLRLVVSNETPKRARLSLVPSLRLAFADGKVWEEPPPPPPASKFAGIMSPNRQDTYPH